MRALAPHRGGGGKDVRRAGGGAGPGRVSRTPSHRGVGGGGPGRADRAPAWIGAVSLLKGRWTGRVAMSSRARARRAGPRCSARPAASRAPVESPRSLWGSPVVGARARPRSSKRPVVRRPAVPRVGPGPAPGPFPARCAALPMGGAAVQPPTVGLGRGRGTRSGGRVDGGLGRERGGGVGGPHSSEAAEHGDAGTFVKPSGDAPGPMGAGRADERPCGGLRGRRGLPGEVRGQPPGGWRTREFLAAVQTRPAARRPGRAGQGSRTLAGPESAGPPPGRRIVRQYALMAEYRSS